MFPAGMLPARRQVFVVEESLLLPKQEVLVNKEPFAHICTSCPTLFLIVWCLCTRAFLV